MTGNLWISSTYSIKPNAIISVLWLQIFNVYNVRSTCMFGLGWIGSVISEWNHVWVHCPFSRSNTRSLAMHNSTDVCSWRSQRSSVADLGGGRCGSMLFPNKGVVATSTAYGRARSLCDHLSPRRSNNLTLLNILEPPLTHISAKELFNMHTVCVTHHSSCSHTFDTAQCQRCMLSWSYFVQSSLSLSLSLSLTDYSHGSTFVNLVWR